MDMRGRTARSHQRSETFAQFRRVFVPMDGDGMLGSRCDQLGFAVRYDRDGTVRLTRKFTAVDESTRHQTLPLQVTRDLRTCLTLGQSGRDVRPLDSIPQRKPAERQEQQRRAKTPPAGERRHLQLLEQRQPVAIAADSLGVELAHIVGQHDPMA